MKEQEENNLFDQTGELIEQPKQSMTWSQMKAFCEGLNEEELKAKVIVWRESECISNLSAMQLEEDHYRDNERLDEGCFPESERNWQIENCDAHADDYEKVYDKGHPVLWEDF